MLFRSVGGRYSDSVLAFRHGSAERDELILVPRLTRRIEATPVGEAWGDTHIVLPTGSASAWENLIDGERHVATRGLLHLKEVFSILPVAALTDVRGRVSTRAPGSQGDSDCQTRLSPGTIRVHSEVEGIGGPRDRRARPAPRCHTVRGNT